MNNVSKYFLTFISSWQCCMKRLRNSFFALASLILIKHKGIHNFFGLVALICAQTFSKQKSRPQATQHASTIQTAAQNILELGE